jgi:hypothetical protein
MKNIPDHLSATTLLSTQILLVQFVVQFVDRAHWQTKFAISGPPWRFLTLLSQRALWLHMAHLLRSLHICKTLRGTDFKTMCSLAPFRLLLQWAWLSSCTSSMFLRNIAPERSREDAHWDYKNPFFGGHCYTVTVLLLLQCCRGQLYWVMIRSIASARDKPLNKTILQ